MIPIHGADIGLLLASVSVRIAGNIAQHPLP
jgi:hypothetical protein